MAWPFIGSFEGLLCPFNWRHRNAALRRDSLLPLHHEWDSDTTASDPQIFADELSSETCNEAWLQGTININHVSFPHPRLAPTCKFSNPVSPPFVSRLPGTPILRCLPVWAWSCRTSLIGPRTLCPTRGSTQDPWPRFGRVQRNLCGFSAVTKWIRISVSSENVIFVVWIYKGHSDRNRTLAITLLSDKIIESFKRQNSSTGDFRADGTGENWL